MILRHYLLFLLIFTVAVFLQTNSIRAAQDSHDSNSNKAKLEQVKAKLTNENKQQKILKQRANKIESELASIKNRLTRLGRSMRKSEDKLKHTQERINKLEKHKSEIKKKLETERTTIVKLILMLERIRKTPPEVLIARPDTPYHTAQSALLMENIIPSVRRDAKRLMNNIETLEQLATDLKIENNNLETELTKWTKKRKKLIDLVKEKEHIYTKVNKDLKARELSIETISLKAKSLEDLIAKIQIEEKREIARQKQAKIFRHKPTSYIDFNNNDTTKAQLPVSGIIRTAFHDTDEYGAKSNGITIEGRPGGLVTAPMSGKIQFIGSFKRFSNIVIIEHGSKLHSLIAGLGEINAFIGDNVKLGEPIGLLPDSTLIPRPKLYYELRKNGSPVNPSVIFSDLG